MDTNEKVENPEERSTEEVVETPEERSTVEVVETPEETVKIPEETAEIPEDIALERGQEVTVPVETVETVEVSEERAPEGNQVVPTPEKAPETAQTPEAFSPNANSSTSSTSSGLPEMNVLAVLMSQAASRQDTVIGSEQNNDETPSTTLRYDNTVPNELEIQTTPLNVDYATIRSIAVRPLEISANQQLERHERTIRITWYTRLITPQPQEPVSPIDFTPIDWYEEVSKGE